MHPSATAIDTLTEPLLAHVSREAGIERAWLDRVTSALLGPTALPQPGIPRPSGLCYDGLALQVCLSAASTGTDIVLIGDPCTGIRGMAQRVQESTRCADTLLTLVDCAAIKAMVDTTIDAMVPSDELGRSQLPLGAVWLAVSVMKQTCAVYTCASWGKDTPETWNRIDRWTQRLLRQGTDARRVVRSLRSIAMPLSACIEGADASQARAKIYFRLSVTDALGSLGFLPIASAPAADFLGQVIGDRALPLRGLVLSVGFLTSTGEIFDAKIDVCCHCVVRPPAEWAAVFGWLADRGLPIDREIVGRMLDLEGAELACIGIGTDVRGSVRVNTYWKPTLPPRS